MSEIKGEEIVETYVATITYNGGKCDVKTVRAKDLKDAWWKVVNEELAGEVHVRSIELSAVVDDTDLR